MDSDSESIFALFVQETDDVYDLEGRIAYAEYKHKKRLFYARHLAEHSSAPSKGETRNWVQAKTYHIDEMREKAANVLEAYADSRIEQESERLENRGRLKALDSEAGKTLTSLRSWPSRLFNFFGSVLASVVASVALAVIFWLYIQSQTG